MSEQELLLLFGDGFSENLDGFGVGAGRCEEAGAGVSEVVNPAEEELARRQDQVARRELDATAVEERLRA